MSDSRSLAASSSISYPLRPSRGSGPRAILPKPLIKTEPREDLTLVVLPNQRHCKVCGNAECLLQSHRFHAKNHSRSSKRQQKHGEDKKFSSSYAAKDQRPRIPPAVIKSWLDPFRTLPVDERSQYFMDASVWTLMGLLMTRTLPFKFSVTSPQVMMKPWFDLMVHDDLTCLTTISMWLAMETSRVVNNVPAALAKIRLEYESRTARLIRLRIQQLGSADDTIIIAAVQMVAIVALHDPDQARIRSLANGASALVRSRGGLQAFTHNYTMLSRIVRSAWIASMVTAQVLPYDGSLLKSPLPPRLSRDLSMLPPLVNIFTELITEDIQDMVSDLRLLLQNCASDDDDDEPSCTADEYKSLIQLLLHTDVQQASLQAQHLNSGSVTEAIVFALILIRLEFIGGFDAQPYMHPLMSRRFKAALTNRDEWAPDVPEVCILWLCSIGAMTSRDTATTPLYLDLLNFVLTSYFETLPAEWPENWEQSLQDLFRNSFPWHKRLDKPFQLACARIST